MIDEPWLREAERLELERLIRICWAINLALGAVVLWLIWRAFH